ncbi:FISUMP domain-containing protein [Gallalistipes aquisgranensis]|uniref:FISUMP domain-containing protein n=1 Tax=Gallalistipes aquisgranensis TaxID=2779358 RepID=UPI001CF8C04D|nr:FISUMP domain-containing protein [Gallalistipes aquisgranensis]MBE5034046.1 hypothetical protein [Gallalistipes aquisgranensis]
MKTHLLNRIVPLVCIAALCGCADDDFKIDNERSFVTPPHAETESIEVAPSLTSATLRIKISGVGLRSAGVIYEEDNYKPTKETGTVVECEELVSGEQEVTVTGLDPSKNYYLRAFATNDRGTHYANVISTLASIEEVELGGITYPTVFYGNRLIMAENVRGIPTGTYNPSSPSIVSQYCYSGEESSYGCLMSWGAANMVCESFGNGWHLPSVEEWAQILTEIEEEAGSIASHIAVINSSTGKGTVNGGLAGLWCKSTSGWGAAEKNGNNNSGMTIEPAGYCSGLAPTSGINHKGLRTLLWSSSTLSTGEGRVVIFHADNTTVSYDANNPNNYGFSVRCVK